MMPWLQSHLYYTIALAGGLGAVVGLFAGAVIADRAAGRTVVGKLW